MLFNAAGAFTKPRSSGSFFRRTSIPHLLAAALLAAVSVAAHGQTTTATTLAVTSGGTGVSTAISGSVVTLTATVTAGSTPVTVGQVNFCDASAAYCADIHLLGTAQLTSAGTAVYKFRPGVGSHSFKAVFLGTPHGATGYSQSSSSAAMLTVSPALKPPVVAIVAANPSVSPTINPYPLTVTVGGTGSAPPTGTLSFVNTSSANQAVGTATLGTGQSQLALINLANRLSFATPADTEVALPGDFNGDGFPDAAIVSLAGVSIFLNDGTGNFTVSYINAPSGLETIAAATGDLNGDGKLDLAITTLENTVWILLGKGDGTFTSVATMPATGQGPKSITVADLNQDGIPDLAIANFNDNTVTVLLGDGDGTFTPSLSSPVTGSNPDAILTGDFNEDGIVDLAVLNNLGSQYGTPGSVTIFLGNGDGTFIQPSASSTASGISGLVLAAGDFNNDGHLDLLVPLGADAFLLLGDGHGGFAAQSYVAIPQGDHVAVADFNQDGNEDLAIVNSETDTVALAPGNGDGTFSTPTAGATTGYDPRSIAVADFNGDGYPDLVSANYGNLGADGASVLMTVTQTSTASVTDPLDLPPGLNTQLIVANYSGDSNYSAGASLPFPISEHLYTPTVTLTPACTVITLLQSCTVEITVDGGPNPTPTGTVELQNEVAPDQLPYEAPALTLVHGAASTTIPPGALLIGTNTLSASYSPDAGAASIYSKAFSTATVDVTMPTFAVSATGVNIASPGASASLTATITPSNSFTGSVALSCTATGGPAVTIDPPTCSIVSPVAISGTDAVTAAVTLSSVPATTPGTYMFTVTGTSSLTLPSETIPITQTASFQTTVGTPVGTTAPTITVTPSAASITDLQMDTVTVTVTGNGQVTPTGSVTIAGVPSGVSGLQALSSGSANFAFTAGSLPAGVNTFTVTYSGDGTYKSATGTTTITVAPAVMSIPTPSAVSPGNNVTATISVTADGHYSGMLNLTCALTQSPSGAQSLPACKLNPTSVSLTAGGTSTTTLTVTTTAASTSSLLRPPGLDPWRAGGVALAGLLLIGIPLRRRRWLAVLVFVWIAIGALAVGCGGGSSSSTPPPVHTTPATTAGNYLFTVTGTDSSNSSLVTSATVTVSVQ